MEYLDNFNLIVGDTILECQRIEHDIKIIYAGMLSGDYDDNIDRIKDKSLGYALNQLKALDNSDNNPYFSEADYQLLNKIKNIRNWLVHKAYIEFMYDRNQRWNTNYNKAFNKLKDFNLRMKNLGNQVENIRIDVMEKYGRA